MPNRELVTNLESGFPLPEEEETVETINSYASGKNSIPNQTETTGTQSRPAAKFRRRSKPYQPIILIMALFLSTLAMNLAAQVSASMDLGIHYTDNAFQLSETDLQNNEEGDPDFAFVNSADDVITNLMLYGAYDMAWHWWKIRPLAEVSGTQYIMNPAKQRLDFLTGIRVSRRIGELGLFYGYTPEVYLRDYIDTDGTGLNESYSYEKNLYRAELKAKPLKKSTASLEYRLEQFYYNKYFTEFDGDITTWTVGWQQSFPIFYLDASYGYKVYQTKQGSIIDNPEDASYESNVYAAGLLIKKMPLDSHYPSITWRPELDLKFETRYYQGEDNWHAGRTDNLNTTTATLHFYFGDRWNFNLDYSHIFRNVDAVNSNVIRQKEFGENRFGLNVRYQLY
jgi:hypothetical protein